MEKLEITERVRPKQVDLGVADYSAEEVRALFFDDNALVEPPYKLYRLDSKSGDRQYYEFNGRGTPKFYLSVTTFIQKALPTSYHLVKWIADMGEVRAEEYKLERAAYGTFLHSKIEGLLITGKYDLDKMEQELTEYVEKNEYSKLLIKKWLYDLKKDVLAFAKFMVDYNVKPIAVEVMLRSKKMGVAGAIDIICSMEIEEKGFFGEVYKTGAKKGQPKESKQVITVKAIVDVKGGRKGFYESHELQLQAYKRMFEENFPKMKIDRVFNWSGSDWRGAPAYKLKDQTDSPVKDKMDYFIKIAKIDWDKKERELLVMGGMIDVKKGAEGIVKNYQVTKMADLVKAKKQARTRKARKSK